jgi:hypothetical protein
MLKNDRRWAAWVTIIQTILIRRDIYAESIALQVLSLALEVDTDKCISGDPHAMTKQAEQFMKYATCPGSAMPDWLVNLKGE